MRNNPLASFATVAAVVSFGLLGWAIGCKGGDATTPSGAGPGDGTSCGADVSSDDHNCGACGHACDAHFYCKAGTCEAGCPDRVLYVSKSGDDHNYGCSRVAPRKTIAATIALARDIGARGHEIHVCQGTYTESGLSLDYPVSLRGAYDCVSWTRTSGYGMAGNFDGAHPTLLEHDGASGATLSIRGASVGADVTIDGLTIHGGNVDQGGGAVLLSSGASPLLSDDQIAGGNAVTAGDFIGSYGIYAEANASPEIARSIVSGGGGNAHGSFGSVGIAIANDAGPPYVHDNRIDGGTGTTTVGVASTGVLFSGKVALTGARAVRSNTIQGGTGHVLDAAGTGSVGVLINDAAAIDLVGNVIQGGSSTCVGPCSVRGVSASGTSGVHLANDRIYGGDASPASATTWGVFIADASDAVLENDMVHGGGAAAGKTLNTAFAVELSGVRGSQLRSNTLVAPRVSAVGQSQALALTRQSTAAAIENDLFVGSRTAQDVGLLLFACPAGSAISSFRNNVFANFADTFAYSVTTASVACDTRGSLSTADALEKFITGTAGASAGQVGGDARVTASPGAIFTAWTDTQSGYPELAGDGWKLAAKTPCPIAQGGYDLQSTPPSDAFGAARHVPYSVGAAELADKSGCTR